jgi:hypothetical protein
MSQIKLAPNASGTGIFTIDSPNSNTNRTLTLPDATGTIITTAGGAAISGTTGTFTGLVDISAAGAGQIKFPATQNASSDVNTLDDYEEGTWTPTFFGSSSAGTTTYNSRAGNYTKVGRLVTVNASMAISSATGTGVVTIGGFPFTSASGTQGRCVPMVNNVNWSGGSYLIIFMYESNTLSEVFYSGDDIAWANQNMTNESMDWVFSMTYVAAA